MVPRSGWVFENTLCKMDSPFLVSSKLIGSRKSAIAHCGLATRERGPYGGVFPMLEPSFEISPQPLRPQSLRERLEDPGAGAVVTFEGWVRNLNEGKPVIALEYEVYDELAVKEGQRILQEGLDRWELKAVHAVHRSGKLVVGDCAVWVGVAAGHRAQAFEACRAIIDELKQRVPIWKKEYYEDGETDWLKGAG